MRKEISSDAVQPEATSVLARASFDLVEGDIGVYVDYAEQIASPGCAPLAIIASDWVNPPYTVQITLENLMFSGTEETSLTATGFSPLMKFGGVMTTPNAAETDHGTILVEIIDNRGRKAKVTHRVTIGCTARSVLTPSLQKAVKHPE